MLAVDLDAEMDEEVKPGSGVPRLAAVKAALRLFVQAKGNAAPRHRFAVAALRDRAEWRARAPLSRPLSSTGPTPPHAPRDVNQLSRGSSAAEYLLLRPTSAGSCRRPRRTSAQSTQRSTGWRAPPPPPPHP